MWGGRIKTVWVECVVVSNDGSLDNEIDPHMYYAFFTWIITLIHVSGKIMSKLARIINSSYSKNEYRKTINTQTQRYIEHIRIGHNKKLWDPNKIVSCSLRNNHNWSHSMTLINHYTLISLNIKLIVIGHELHAMSGALFLRFKILIHCNHHTIFFPCIHTHTIS